MSIYASARAARETSGEPACLVVLIGVTASGDKIAALKGYLVRHFDGGIYVPDLPLRRGLSYCAGWMVRFLVEERVFTGFANVHFIAYIAGGLALRLAAPGLASQDIGRVVWLRGPIQERVPAALVRRYTWPLIRLTQGRTVTELASPGGAEVPFPRIGRENALIVETGASRLAQRLGVLEDTVPKEAWEPEVLCPGALDVLHVPESHDDVYTSSRVLGAALSFIRMGRFHRDEALT